VSAGGREQLDAGVAPEEPDSRCPNCGHLWAQHYVTGECEVCTHCDDVDEEEP
jgi:ribosomal protein L32